MKTLAVLVLLAAMCAPGAHAQDTLATDDSDAQMAPSSASTFQGLRTALYVVDDLDQAKAWYTNVLGIAPYFDEPFYVGFNVGGYELGLLPSEGDNRPGAGGTVAYWGVEDANAAMSHLLEAGATEREPVQDVGGGIKTATVLDPFGNVFGVIENPHFELPDR